MTPIEEMSKTVQCLALELPQAVWEDLNNRWQAVIDASRPVDDFRVTEFHEQGHPEIIELKHKGKWMRYHHFSKDHERRMNDYIKKSVSKHGG